MPVFFFFQKLNNKSISLHTLHLLITLICYNRSDRPLPGLTRVKNKQTNLNSRNIGSVFMALVHRTYTLCLCPELAVVDPRFCGVPVFILV